MSSQNALFRGEVPEDEEFEHPLGAWLARFLEASLKEAGWQTSEFENWRDSGWSIACSREKTRLTMVLSTSDEMEWFLQVAPSDSPGLARGLLGAKTSAQPSDVLALARAVHDILKRSARFSGFMWRWNAPPSEKESTPEPVEKGALST